MNLSQTTQTSNNFFDHIPELVEPSPRWVRVKFGGEIIADSKRALLLQQFGPDRMPTYYFPPEDVRMDLLEPSRLTTQCPYKGIAAYWSVKIGDHVTKNMVWSYPEPIPECYKIKGLLCFFNEKADLYVDGKLQERPRTPWSQ